MNRFPFNFEQKVNVFFWSSWDSLPGTVSPLNVIWTVWVPDSWGVKLAMNRWAPNARTDDVTRPPLTKISKLPDPAWEPSTESNNSQCVFRIRIDIKWNRCSLMAHVRSHTFEFNWSPDSTVGNVLNADCSSTRHILLNWSEASWGAVSIIAIRFRRILLSFFQRRVLLGGILFRWKWSDRPEK